MAKILCKPVPVAINTGIDSPSRLGRLGSASNPIRVPSLSVAGAIIALDLERLEMLHIRGAFRLDGSFLGYDYDHQRWLDITVNSAVAVEAGESVGGMEL